MSLRKLRNSIIEFLIEEDGAAGVEYAVMLSLIVIVCIVSINAVATETGESFDTTEAAISGAFGN